MKELQELAARLLSEGEVGVVIGYEEGPRGLRPAFVQDPTEVGRLVVDSRAVHNLASYLSPRRAHLSGMGKPAIVVKGCDNRAVATLIRESQIQREDVVLIGVRCSGVARDPSDKRPLTARTVSDKCAGCLDREAPNVDHIVGASAAAPPEPMRRADLMAKIDAMSPAERFEWWSTELDRCVRCNACREVCPLCVCGKCLADKNDPVWIETSSHLRGCFSWHMTHAMHLAGRCSDCGECERACPSGIALSVLNGKVAGVVFDRFGYRAGTDPDEKAPIGDFRSDDSQEFIK